MALEQLTPIQFTKLRQDEYPYLFSEKGYKCSEKYEAIKTIDVIKNFVEAGCQVIRVDSQDSQKVPKKYQKHIVVMNHKKFKSESDYQTQIILINSGDGTTKFSLYFGSFVFLCLNGLMVGDTYFETPQIKHIGYDTANRVESVVEEMIKRSVRLTELIQFLKETNLSKRNRTAIAKEAISVRWHKSDPDKDSLPKEPIELLKTRRKEDEQFEETAWGVLNILQENLIKGGFYVTSTNEDKKTLFLREVKSLQLEIMINLTVWNLVCEKARAPLI